MLINELSKRTGITVHTIRFYEKSGLIKGKRNESVTSNNYYHYDDETVEKLELIRYAKSVGFTIQEISQLIDAWFDKRLSQSEKIKVLDEKLQFIEQQIQQLVEMKEMIHQFKLDVLENDC